MTDWTPINQTLPTKVSQNATKQSSLRPSVFAPKQSTSNSTKTISGASNRETPKTRKANDKTKDSSKSKPSTPIRTARATTPSTLDSLPSLYTNPAKGFKKKHRKDQDPTSPSKKDRERAPLRETDANIQARKEIVEDPTKKSDKIPSKTTKSRSKTLDGSSTRPTAILGFEDLEKPPDGSDPQLQPDNERSTLNRQVLFPRQAKVLPSIERSEDNAGKSKGRKRSHTTTDVDLQQLYGGRNELPAAALNQSSPPTSSTTKSKAPKSKRSNIISLDGSPTPEVDARRLAASPTPMSPSPSQQLRPSVEDVNSRKRLMPTSSGDRSEGIQEPKIKVETLAPRIIRKMATPVPISERKEHVDQSLRRKDVVELRPSWVYEGMGQELDELTSSMLDAVNEDAMQKNERIMRRYLTVSKALNRSTNSAELKEAQFDSATDSQAAIDVDRALGMLAREAVEADNPTTHRVGSIIPQGAGPSFAAHGQPVQSTFAFSSSHESQAPPWQPLQIAPGSIPATGVAELAEVPETPQRPRADILNRVSGNEASTAQGGSRARSRGSTESQRSRSLQRTSDGIASVQGLDYAGTSAAPAEHASRSKASRSSGRDPKTPTRASTPRSSRGSRSGDGSNSNHRNAQAIAQVPEPIQDRGKALVVGLLKPNAMSRSAPATATQPGVEVRVPVVAKTPSQSTKVSNQNAAQADNPPPETADGTDLASMLRREQEKSRQSSRTHGMFSQTVQNLFKRQFVPAFPPCTCQCLPKSFTEDLDWVPTRIQFRGGGLEYFSHLSQVMDCVGHPERVRAYCRRKWYIESRRPNTYCDRRGETPSIRSTDTDTIANELDNEAAAPHESTQSRQSEDVSTATQTLGQPTPPPSSPPKSRSKSDKVSDGEPRPHANSARGPSHTGSLLPPESLPPKSKDKKRKHREHVEREDPDPSDGQTRLSQLTQKKRKKQKRSETRGTDASANTSPAPDSPSHVTPAPGRRCTATKKTHGKGADDADCSPSPHQGSRSRDSSPSARKARKRKHSSVSPDDQDDVLDSYNAYDGPGYDDGIEPVIDEEEYPAIDHPMSGSQRVSPAPMHTSGQHTSQKAIGTSVGGVFHGFSPVATRRYQSVPPSRVTRREISGATIHVLVPSFATELAIKKAVEAVVRSQVPVALQEALAGRGTVQTTALPQGISEPLVHPVAPAVATPSIATAPHRQGQIGTINPKDDPELMNMKFPQALRWTDDRLIALSLDRAYGPNKRHDAAPYAFLEETGFFTLAYFNDFKRKGLFNDFNPDDWWRLLNPWKHPKKRKTSRRDTLLGGS